MSKSAADKVAQAKLEGLVELEPKPKRYALPELNDYFVVDETPKTAKPTAPRKTAPFKVSPSAALKSYFRKAEVLELMQLGYNEGVHEVTSALQNEAKGIDLGNKQEGARIRYERVSLALDKWLSR